MTLDSVRGQDPAVRVIRRALETGRIHHAYRFEGPLGVGKGKLALTFAQGLLCDENQGRGPGCGECRSCARVVTFADDKPLVPLHPDVLLVERDLYPPATLGKKPDQHEKTGIGVAQIRRILLDRVNLPPHEGRALVCIIEGADEISVEAANLLLKTLEEPKSGVFFVLVTSRPARLLDTIRSRSLPVRFGRLGEATLERLLRERGFGPEFASPADGSIRRAIELAETESAPADGYRPIGARLLASLEGQTPAEAFAAVEDKSDSSTLRRELTAFAAELATKAKEAVRTDPEAAARLARQFSAVLRGRDQLEANGSPALCMESLALTLRRA